MTISSQKVWERLKEFARPVDLQKEEDKQRIFKLLKTIKNAKNGISTTELKESKQIGFSNTHLIPYLRWLKETGHLTQEKGAKRLTQKGEEALRELDEYLCTPETALKISWDLPSKKEVEASMKGKLDNITKMAIFSKDFVQNKIIELSAALSLIPEDVELTIRIQPIEPNIHAFLRLLWSFYWRITTPLGGTPSVFGLLSLKLNLKGEGKEDAYTKFWKKHLEDFYKFKGITAKGFAEINGRREETEASPLLPPLPSELEPLFMIQLKDGAIRNWVEGRLEKYPDWFMPHPIWVDLGFKQRRDALSVDSVTHVSPPIFHEISSPELPEQFGDLEIILRDVVKKGEENTINAFCNWIKLDSVWRNSGFYKSWGILRKEYKNKIVDDPRLGEVARILDQALCEYIISDHRPNVNLQLALEDHVRSKKGANNVVARIRDGEYKI